MPNAVLLAGDRYHIPEDAFAGVGPALEAAGLAPLYTTDCAALDADLLAGQRLLHNAARWLVDRARPQSPPS